MPRPLTEVFASMTPLWLLIAGFPRGGTQYAANLLTKCGFRAGHESIFKNGQIVSEGAAEIEVSGFATPYLAAIARSGTPIVHLLREPVANITSKVNYWRNRGHRITWDQACLEWFAAHETIDEFSQFTVRVEDLGKHIPEIVRLFADPEERIPTCDQIADAEKLAARGESMAGGIWVWNDLPAGLKDYAQRHGYEGEA